MTVDNGFKVNVDWRVGELGRGISHPKCFGLNITNSKINVISRAVQFSSKKKIKENTASKSRRWTHTHFWLWLQTHITHSRKHWWSKVCITQLFTEAVRDWTCSLVQLSLWKEYESKVISFLASLFGNFCCSLHPSSLSARAYTPNAHPASPLWSWDKTGQDPLSKAGLLLAAWLLACILCWPENERHRARAPWRDDIAASPPPWQAWSF